MLWLIECTHVDAVAALPHVDAVAALPQVIGRAQRHPDFYKAIKEISDSPSTATMQRWIDHPDVGPLVAEIWKSSQGK
jgi:hypothetical protein